MAFTLVCYQCLSTYYFPRRRSGAAVPSDEPAMIDEPLEEPFDVSDAEDENDVLPLTEQEEAAQRAAGMIAAREASDAVVKKLEEDYTGDNDVRSN